MPPIRVKVGGVGSKIFPYCISFISSSADRGPVAIGFAPGAGMSDNDNALS
jgi:hypothetical protein